MAYVLDTHALIWYFTGNTRLSRKIVNAIDEARNRGEILLVPTIVLAEALYIAEKGKVKFDFENMYSIIKNEPEFVITGFDEEILEETIKTDIPEIHDRIIVATAKFYNSGIITKDKVISRYSETSK